MILFHPTGENTMSNAVQPIVLSHTPIVIAKGIIATRFEAIDWATCYSLASIREIAERNGGAILLSEQLFLSLPSHELWALVQRSRAHFALGHLSEEVQDETLISDKVLLMEADAYAGDISGRIFLREAVRKLILYTVQQQGDGLHLLKALCDVHEARMVALSQKLRRPEPETA